MTQPEVRSTSSTPSGLVSLATMVTPRTAAPVSSVAAGVPLTATV